MKQFVRPLALLLLMIGVGCGGSVQPQKQPVATGTWTGWVGDTNVDPNDDMKSLQGTWREMQIVANDSGTTRVIVKFNTDTVTFEPAHIIPDPFSNSQSFKYVLNSSLNPKVIRLTHEITSNGLKPLSSKSAEYNRMYTHNGDVFTMWTKWPENERPKISYERIKQ